MTVRPGRLRAELRAAALVLACAAASGCGNDVITDLDASNAAVPLKPVTISTTAGGILQLDLATYEGSGQSVEQDVIHFPTGWRGYEYWMVYEPYPNGNSYYENASIAVSHDGLAWTAPPGIRNPVIPGPGFQGINHNSDPDLTYVHQLDRLVLTYRAVTLDRNIMFAVSSIDGVHWSPPVKVFDVRAHEMVMPTKVLAPGRRAKLYYVDAGREGCGAQATGVWLRRWMGDLHADDALVGTKWSDKVHVDMMPPPGWVIWHLDVVWVEERREYWAIFPAHQAWEDCGHNDLFMARSRDGVTWRVLPDPVLRRGEALWTGGTLYRASLEYDAAHAGFRVWFSGRSVGNQWHIGHQTFPLSELLDQFDHVR